MAYQILSTFFSESTTTTNHIFYAFLPQEALLIFFSDDSNNYHLCLSAIFFFFLTATSNPHHHRYFPAFINTDARFSNKFAPLQISYRSRFPHLIWVPAKSMRCCRSAITSLQHKQRTKICNTSSAIGHVMEVFLLSPDLKHVMKVLRFNETLFWCS